MASAAALAAVPAATASLAGAFLITWLTTWLTIWPVISGSALRVTTSLLSSKHGLPEHNST